MATLEQPCYTLINIPTDSEPPNEMQLKQDLGMSLRSGVDGYSFIIHYENLYSTSQIGIFRGAYNDTIIMIES